MQAAEKLITQNLDVWTSAVKAKSSAGRGSSNKRELYGVQKLRELILDLAVRGLLVPQDPNDEPASELLKQIDSERHRLAKAGIFKKPKPLVAVEQNETPFELPEGWAFTRNGALFGLKKGKVPKDLSESEGSIPYLDIEALDRGNIRRHTNDEKAPKSTEEDILVVCDGSRSGLVLDGKNGAIGSTLSVIETPLIIQGYVKLVFLQAYQRLNSTMKGAAIPHLDTKQLLIDIIGLPPLAEQHRIVAKVDELMGLCDQLEQEQESSLDTHDTLVATLLGALTTATADAGQFAEAWHRIQANFDTLFTTESSIDQLKQTILQLAVTGELSTPLDSDTPVAALQEDLNRERKKLKTGSKKSKTTEEIPLAPFKIPNHWARIPLNEIGVLGGGMTPSKSKSEYWDGDINWFSSKDIKTDYLLESELKITTEGLSSTRLSLYPPGSLFIVARSGILKHTLPVSIAQSSGTSNQDLKVLQPFVSNLERYLQIMFRGMNDFIIAHLVKRGMTVQSLKYDEFSTYSFPIPPTEEQHRIVAKVDELMALCDQLKASLATAQTTQINLADSLVEQAIG